jgi:transposase-like protein
MAGRNVAGVNCKNGVSSYEVHRAIGVTQKTAWFMDHRLRFALSQGTINKLSGQVEADETYIGGKARNMHPAKRAAKITGTGGKDKTAVMGILERGGKVRTKVVDNTKKKTLQAEIDEHVLAGSALFTDALKSYEGLSEFQHEVIDHAVEYVRSLAVPKGKTKIGMHNGRGSGGPGPTGTAFYVRSGALSRRLV